MTIRLYQKETGFFLNCRCDVCGGPAEMGGLETWLEVTEGDEEEHLFLCTLCERAAVEGRLSKVLTKASSMLEEQSKFFMEMSRATVELPESPIIAECVFP